MRGSQRAYGVSNLGSENNGTSKTPSQKIEGGMPFTLFFPVKGSSNPSNAS